MAISIRPAPSASEARFTARISATAIDTYATCPRRYAAQTEERKEGERTSSALQRGLMVHRTLAQYNRQVQRSGPPDVDQFVDAIWPPTDPVSEEHDTLVDLARDALLGYGAFLAERSLRVVAPEQFISSPPRPLVTAAHIAVILSTRIDVLLADMRTGALLALDYKFQSRPLPTPLDLAEAPSSTIVTLLADLWVPDAPSITVAQMLPHRGELVSARLTPEQIEAGRACIRRLACAMERDARATGVAPAEGGPEDAFPPTPGEHCGICRFIGTCPAHLRPTWEAGAF